MSTLVLRDISKSYGNNQILDGISIEAAEGEFIALVGPSGCGKSTLLRILAGLDHADEGSIAIAGRDITGAHPADRNMAMVFQSYALYPHLTAAQNIAVPLAMRDMTTLERFPLVGVLVPGQRKKRAAIQKQVKATATSLKIDHLLDRKPGQMSGGQRQRVALARALVRQPGAFLMDEPLSNLDANLRVHTRAEIVELHRRAGVPTIYVTHDQAEALSMADRVAVMMGGKLLQIDTPTAIYNDPKHIEVAQFIGTPRINILDALVSDNGIVHFAGLTAIPRELYSAAEVDGVKSSWERFRLVTWPLLGPTTLFVTTISIINAVKVFETVKTLTEGGPNKASEVLLWTIYQEGFVYLRVGYASAMTVIFLAVLIVLMMLQFRVLDRRTHY